MNLGRLQRAGVELVRAEVETWTWSGGRSPRRPGELPYDRLVVALGAIGPLLEQVARPVGGWIADWMGAERVLLVSFAGISALAATLTGFYTPIVPLTSPA